MADFASAQTTWGGETTTLLALMKTLSGVTGSGQDVTLSMYLEIAGTAAEGYIDNTILERSVVQKLSKPMSPVRLHYSPFVSLTTVEVDEVDVTADYETFQDDAITWLTCSRSGLTREASFKQMAITYTAGRSTLPTDMAYAIVRTAMTYEDSDFTGSARRETVVGVGTIEYGSGGQGDVVLPPTATTVLDRYRNWSA